MAIAPAGLMTVEQYRELHEDSEAYVYELHYGKLVAVSRPSLRHRVLQHRLLELLRHFCSNAGVVHVEFAFRALPEHDLRAADVAFVRLERFNATDPDDNLHGAPELVIEILSPSNRARDLLEKETLCLQNGCLEFWVIDDRRRRVRVTTAEGRVTNYEHDQCIPLPLFNSELPVARIFDTV